MIHIYSFASQKMLLFSDHTKEKINQKYGHKYEILNSIKDKNSLHFIKEKMQRQCPTFMIVEDYYVKKVVSEETKKKMRLSQLGKKKPDWVKNKISKSRAGKGNHNKKHTLETKKRIASKRIDRGDIIGNKKYIYNPSTDQERRVADIINLPPGFRKGRDPEVIEMWQYGSLRSRNSK